MKTSIVTILFVCALTITTVAWSQSTIPTVAFDENGNGTFNGNQIDHVYVPGQSFYYILPFAANAGDVAVLEPDGTISDVLRFSPVPGAVATYLYVFSDAEATELKPDMADLGLPQDLSANVVRFQETGDESGWNGLLYEPSSPNDPGYVATNGILYNFTSDVPEPTTIALLGLGGAALLRRRR